MNKTNFFRSTLLTTFCLVGMFGCNGSDDDSGLSEEEMQDLSRSTFEIVDTSLTALNAHFTLADLTINALHLLDAKPGTIENACAYEGNYTASYDGDTLTMEFSECSFTPAVVEYLNGNLNGSLSLSFYNYIDDEAYFIKKEGDFLAFKGRLYGRDLSWGVGKSYSYTRPAPGIKADFDAVLTQTITAPNQTLTDLKFDQYTRIVTESQYWPQIGFSTPTNYAKFSDMRIQRALDYETGINSISYDGEILELNDEDLKLKITTAKPIERIRRKILEGGSLVISDDDQIQLTTTTTVPDYYREEVNMTAEFKEGDIYELPYSLTSNFMDYNLSLLFPARNPQLLKYNLFSFNEFENETRFAYLNLSPNQVYLSTLETQLGSISIAIIPVFDNLGEFTVSVIDRETETEINSDLYSISLDNIWVNITFDSSLASDIMHRVIITDDMGQTILLDVKITQ